MRVFDRDELRFRYRDEGRGLPTVFQHGLGGDLSQPFARMGRRIPWATRRV
jgi:hypothetical protein